MAYGDNFRLFGGSAIYVNFRVLYRGIRLPRIIEIEFYIFL